jgi:hypothetical protein
MQRRCDRKRKRSQRRAIFCPIHGDYLHSVSQKYSLFADQAEQLQSRGVGRRSALMLVATRTTILLSGEWLESFWCDECQQTQWYHIRKLENNRYELSHAPAEVWQQAIGVVSSQGNPSVGEFTKRQACIASYQLVKEFQFMK